MAISVTFQYHDGANWIAITDASEFLAFSGSPRNVAVPLGYQRWQRGSHLASAWPGVDLCGAGHLPNVRYLTSATCDLGAGSIALTDAAVGAGEKVTFRVRVQCDEGPITVHGAKLYVYDVFGATRPVQDVEVQAWEYGVGATAWTQINDGDTVGGSASGLALADKSVGAATQYFYVALSARALAPEVLPTLNLGFSITAYGIDQAIAASSDDAYERVDTGAVALTNTYAFINYYTAISSQVWAGFRWLNLPIPQGATLTSAYLRLKARNADSTALTVTIKGEGSLTPATFAVAGNNISSRTPTTATVAWTPAAWVIDNWYDTPDIKAIVAENTGNVGWTPGASDLALLVQPDGSTTNPRRAYSFDHSAANAPRLVVRWTPATASFSWGARVVNTSGEPVYEVWVLDGSHKRYTLIDDILELEWDIERQGRRSFSLRLPYDSIARADLETYDLLKIRRGGCDLLDVRNEDPRFKLPPEGLASADAKAEGRGLEHILDERIIIPDTGDNYMEIGPGRPDDNAKDLVRYNMATGFVTDADRVFAGLSVASDRAEVPLPAAAEEQTFKGALNDVLYDLVQDKATAYDFDFEVRADGVGNLKFETYYPRMGEDRSVGNTDGNDEVVLAVTRDNIVGIETYNSKFNVRNVILVGGLGEGAARLVVEVEDTVSVAAYRRRELFVDMGGVDDEDILTQQGKVALAINGNPIKGITVIVNQTADFKVHRDLWVGERCSVFFDPFDVTLDDAWEVQRIRGKLNADGTETIEITLGLVAPSLLDVIDSGRKSGGASGHGETPPLNTPTTIFAGDTANKGTGPHRSYDDHRHGVTTGAPNGGIGSSNLEGVANSLARSDHQHNCPRYSHTHDVSGDTSEVTLATHSLSGAIANASIADHTLSGRTGGCYEAIVCDETDGAMPPVGYSAIDADVPKHTHMAYRHSINHTHFGGAASGGASSTSATLAVSAHADHGHGNGTLAVSAHAAHKHSADGSLATGAPS